jgi:hypothetical protein
MNRIIQAIGHFVKHAAVWVSRQFVKLFGSDIAQTFAVGALGLLKSPIGLIAATVVQELVALKIPSTEKASMAASKIASAAKAAGIVIAGSEINLLIEVAVQALKQKFGPGDAPPTS